MKYFICCVLLFITFSCNAQKKTFEKQLKECIKVNINGKDIYKIDSSLDIDIYDIVIQIEKLLKKKGYIKNYNSKKGYIDFIESIYKNQMVLLRKISKEISTVCESNNYNELYIGNIILQQCPHFVGAKSEDSELSIKKQIQALDKLYAFDPYNKDYIKKVVNSVSDKDFKNVIYRVPAFIVISDYINHNIKN